MIKTSYIPIIISLDELTELGRAGDLDDDIHRRQVEDSIERQEAQEAVNNFLYSIPLKDRENSSLLVLGLPGLTKTPLKRLASTIHDSLMISSGRL